MKTWAQRKIEVVDPAQYRPLAIEEIIKEGDMKKDFPDGLCPVESVKVLHNGETRSCSLVGHSVFDGGVGIFYRPINQPLEEK
jgi:hypothetical protein